MHACTGASICIGTHPFKLLSDHDSLKYHKTMPNLSRRLARWIEKMAEFNYTIEHIAGVKNVVADALSRRADLKSPKADLKSPTVMHSLANLLATPQVDSKLAAVAQQLQA